MAQRVKGKHEELRADPPEPREKAGHDSACVPVISILKVERGGFQGLGASRSTETLVTKAVTWNAKGYSKINTFYTFAWISTLVHTHAHITDTIHAHENK